MTTEQDVTAGLEREFGRNGWRFLGKLASLVAIPVIIQTGAAVWWASSLSASVAENKTQISKNEGSISSISQQLFQSARRNGARDEALENLRDSIERLTQEIRQLRDQRQ